MVTEWPIYNWLIRSIDSNCFAHGVIIGIGGHACEGDEVVGGCLDGRGTGGVEGKY